MGKGQNRRSRGSHSLHGHSWRSALSCEAWQRSFRFDGTPGKGPILRPFSESARWMYEVQGLSAAEIGRVIGLTARHVRLWIAGKGWTNSFCDLCETPIIRRKAVVYQDKEASLANYKLVFCSDACKSEWLEEES